MKFGRGKPQMANKSEIKQEIMPIKLLNSPKESEEKKVKKETAIYNFMVDNKKERELEIRLKSMESTLAKHGKEIDLIERILTSRGNRR